MELCPSVSAAAAAGALAYICYRCFSRDRPMDTWAILKDRPLSDITPLQFWQLVKTALHPPSAVERAAAFRPKAGDVVSLTTPKTGQTWLLAQLRMLSMKSKRSGTALAFKAGDSDDGIPWLEHALKMDPDQPQPGDFRVFKSHLKLEKARAMLDASPHARFVTCLRQPHDVVLSFHKHMRGRWSLRCNNGDPAPFDAAYTASDFAIAGLPAGYEEEILGWLELKDRPNVLILWYEEMLADPLAALRRLAEFLGVTLGAELEAAILDATNYEQMAADPAFVNVFPGGGTYGRGRKLLTARAVEAVDERWAAVKAKTGAESYEALYSLMHGGAAFPFK